MTVDVPSIYNLDAVENLRRQMRLEPQSIQKLYRRLFKHFSPDDIVRMQFPFVDQLAVHELELRHRFDSKLDGASKLLFQTSQRMMIESVIIRTSSGRTSLCISSQVGCAAACGFCATGQMGISRNLQPQEILDQLLVASQLMKLEQRLIRNVVFMGMGEPFHNEANVYDAIETMISKHFFHLSPTKILVSTVGIPDAMERCALRFPGIRVALSLHSVRQDVREELMPLARTYSLESLRESVSRINRIQSHPVMIEYLMLADRNDSTADAILLQEWVSGLNTHVNLIPFNPIAEAPGLRGSDRPTCRRFADSLKAKGIKTTIRYSFGSDISAACGQLVQHENRRLAMESTIKSVRVND